MISILILKIVAALNGMVLELWFMMRQTGHLIICPVIPPYKGADNAHQPSHHLAAAPPTKKQAMGHCPLTVPTSCFSQTAHTSFKQEI